MINLDQSVSYVAYEGEAIARRSAIPPDVVPEHYIRSTLAFLVETASEVPEPVAIVRETLDGTKHDVIHVLFNGASYGYVLDTKTHLPTAFISYDDKGHPLETVWMRDYTNVQGIMMPSKVGFSRGHYGKATFELNVHIKKQFFDTPPRAELGPDAFRASGGGA